jgi:hypothetical protein
MGMTPKLHSIESIAVETGRDRRTVAKALSGIAPDGELRGKPAWRLATAIKALNRRSGEGGSGNDADELLQLAKKIESGFKRAHDIADLGERREFLKELGPSIGQMDQKLSALNPDDEIVGTIVHEHILGGTISEFLALMEMKLVVPDQPEPSAST